MHIKIKKALRNALRRAWPKYRQLEARSEEGGFEDIYVLRDSVILKANLSVIGSPTTDTFAVRVKWDSNRVPRRSVIAYRPEFRVTNGQRSYSFHDLPTLAEFDLGILAHGRNVTYHLLARPRADDPVSIEQMYSSGDGPEYRLKRLPAAVDLVSEQVRDYLDPYLDALSAHLSDVPSKPPT